MCKFKLFDRKLLVYIDTIVHKKSENTPYYDFNYITNYIQKNMLANYAASSHMISHGSQ